jgi:hypothetical protein
MLNFQGEVSDFNFSIVHIEDFFLNLHRKKLHIRFNLVTKLQGASCPNVVILEHTRNFGRHEKGLTQQATIWKLAF